MDQNTDEYYVLFKSWSLDPNQWSMVIDSVAALLTILGFLIAFLVYNIQRKDSSKDAFDFFQSSLPELKQSIISAINDLKTFHDSIDLDDIVNPVLSASLNDKFLNKINLVDLSRFYAQNRSLDRLVFRQFLVDSNFFGDYHAYITSEIAYFRTNYHQKKEVYSKWKLLRSPQFFATDSSPEDKAYQDFYTRWVNHLNNDTKIFDFHEHKQPTIKNRDTLVNSKIKELAQGIYPFVDENQRANKVNILANDIMAAYADINKMKIKIRKTLTNDIAKFERVLANLNKLEE